MWVESISRAIWRTSTKSVDIHNQPAEHATTNFTFWWFNNSSRSYYNRFWIRINSNGRFTRDRSIIAAWTVPTTFRHRLKFQACWHIKRSHKFIRIRTKQLIYYLSGKKNTYLCSKGFLLNQWSCIFTKVEWASKQASPPVWNAWGHPAQSNKSPPTPQIQHMSSLSPFVMTWPSANDRAMSCNDSPEDMQIWR